ncbi:MAG: RsmB/NOP family class I SAM-dependent RNA methyltransferase [Candidatus Omnitrophica bacterium]|nr:RsmB/NOP family class I SAM-dependent RNA methyltransferase [Candidatus Omnitrophota bacterium]
MKSQEHNHSKHNYARALSYSNAISEIFYAVMRKRYPLDREIKNYFRKHKECGSKDRFLITESLFSLFRWYGWVKGKLPNNQPENPLKSKKFCVGLSAVLWLDNQPFVQFMEILYDAAGIDATWLKSSPDLIEDKIKGLSHFFKIRKCDVLDLVPEWFRKEIKDDDLRSMIEPFQKRPPIWIRVQNNAEEIVFKELKNLGIDLAQHEGISNAFKLSTSKLNLKDIESYQNGLFEIQDLASQCLGLACGVSADQSWWDVCAGAGGKSLLLADQMKGQGKIVATGNREEIKKRATRANFKNICITDLDKIVLSQHSFDGVLVDAPCSCTGTWRRNPDLRWTSLRNVCEQSACVQKEILEFAFKKVKPGGVLVYATCSLSVQENEDIVSHFLKTSPEFALEDFFHPLTGKPTGGMMHVKFDLDDCDATFAARFRRK